LGFHPPRPSSKLVAVRPFERRLPHDVQTLMPKHKCPRLQGLVHRARPAKRVRLFTLHIRDCLLGLFLLRGSLCFTVRTQRALCLSTQRPH
jgi:hypothetical protein